MTPRHLIPQGSDYRKSNLFDSAGQMAIIRPMKKHHRAFYKSPFLIEFLERPHYAYALFNAAQQALALGYKAISVIEFGVAGGNGLVCIEKHAKTLSRLLGISFEIYGFDTATGLPKLEGYPDVMHQWKEGSFPMDIDKLKSRLTTAQLVLGNVSDTLQDFYTKYTPAPVGAILFDVDLYSSTKAALKIFDTDPSNLIPRVRCYFDDIIGNETSLTNEFMGEKLAVAEYNSASPSRKITPVYHLHARPYRRKWHLKSFVHHCYDHPRYSDFIAKPEQLLPLREA